MEEKFNLNVPKVGMQLSKSHSELQPQEYSLLVNGNIESFDTSPLKVTNESSNLLCSHFKPNFQITGILPVNPLNKTYYFLKNPLTNESEIGYINNTSYQDTNDKEVNCQDCNNATLEPTPLELLTQNPLCTYNTFISDSCLNFNVLEPISATFRINNRGLVIFFAQPNKPLRYIEEYDVPYTLIPQDISPSGCTECGEPQYTNQLDCNRIKILKDYQDPCISLIDVTSNGSLTAGVYQFVFTYADERQSELTDFSNYSLPISIYQRPLTVNTDYPTNQAIKLRISNLSQEFENFKLVVVETVNNISTAYQIGVFPITSSEFIYTYTGNNRTAEIQISPNELRRKRPVYTSSSLVAQNNDFLFWGKLKEQAPINLQPVVNTLRIKPATIETFEGFYKNPLSYNSVSYLRDEVVPFSIYFKTNIGYQTADFLISNEDVQYYQTKLGRDPEGIVPKENPNVISTEGCGDEFPDKYWQVFNAAPSGFTNLCGYIDPTDDVRTVPRQIVISCSSIEYREGVDPEPLDCTSPDPIYDNPLPCITEVISPSGVVEYLTYLPGEKTINAPKPKDNNRKEASVANDVFFQSTVIEGTPPNITQIPYTPNNTTLGNATDVISGSGNACSTDLTGEPFNTTGVGLTKYPRVFFSNQGNVTVNYFRLQVTNPVATAIKIKMFTSDTPKITVTKQNGGIVNHYDTINNNSTTDGFFLIINNLNGINTGDTLNIIVESIGISSFPLPVWDGDINELDPPTPIPNWYNYGNMCIYNPTPTLDKPKPRAVPRILIKTCSFFTIVNERVVGDLTCFQRPARQYDFAYWESSLCYPNNPEIWGDLCGKPIRYHKFPEPKIAPLHDSVTQGSTNLSDRKVRIYPIGIQLDINDVKSILNLAVTQGLISEEQKKQITSYGIKRGNRRQNKSIVAKGLLYDMWRTFILNEYKASVTTENPTPKFEYYPNYPYNDLRDDAFIQTSLLNTSKIRHPFSDASLGSGFRHNNRYTFHSPETSYNNPILGREFKIDSIEWGFANVQLSQVDDHAKYVLLTEIAVRASEAIASGRIVLEATLAAFSAGSFSFTILGSGTDLSIINFVIYLAIGLAAGFIANLDKYTIEQKEIFKNLLNPFNYCYYYHSVGNYNNSSFLPTYTDNQLLTRRASLNQPIYLQPGNIAISEYSQTTNINNFNRESSVYFSLENRQDNNGNLTIPNFFNRPDAYTPTQDTSRPIIRNLNEIAPTTIVSYYGSIKNYVPDQYGLPEQIEWVDTGYCGRIDWENEQSNECEIIFGGDTYIGRHTLKRKYPYFLQDRVNFPEDTDVNFQEIGNVGYPTYWFNSTNTYLDPIRRPRDLARRPTSANLSQNQVEFDAEQTVGLTPGSFQRLGKIYLYQYGVPNFICESDYNLDLRHGENNTDKNYYPNILDTEEWTQQTNVPISVDNYYFYNTTYSKQLTENLYYALKPFYNQIEENLKTNRKNRVLQSKQYNPYSYSANDYYDFDFNDGDLTGIKGIEQQAVLVTQTNASSVFNAFITVASSLANIQVTTGSVFGQKPRQYYKTDLGYGGATQQQITSTPYGHFFIDAENPSIFQLQGDSEKDITQDTDNKKVRQWFIQNIPFQIKKQFPLINTDNPLNNTGFSMGWDNKFQRLFITKLDYKLKSKYLNKVTLQDQQFYIDDTIISITDSEFFENKSWTVSYSPKVDQFISFYSFKPNNYISNETYFQTVYNSPASVHSHLLTAQSYQVFNGTLHPFILEYITKSQYSTDYLKAVSYISEFRRYQDNLNYYLVQNKTFDKALIYTDSQTTGYLSLIPKQDNNQYQQVAYPKLTLINSIPHTEILVDNVQNQYNFNQFQDRVNDINISKNNSIQTQFNTNPILQYNPNNPAYKELNTKALNYQLYQQKRNLFNDYFVVRLINSIYSNYQITTQHFITNQQPYGI